MKNFDAEVAAYIERLIEFSPDSSSDEERAAVIADGAKLLEEKSQPARPRTMEDLVDELAGGVDTGATAMPSYVLHDAELARRSVADIIAARKATKEAYRNGAMAIATALIKVAALA